MMQEKLGGETHGPMEVRVWLRLLTCAMLLEKKIRRNFAEQFDTTLPRFDVLASLDRHAEGQTMGELSRALLVSNGNVTSIVRHLQEEGLVVAKADPEDRRSSIVELTPKGKTVFTQLARAHHGWIKDAMKRFPHDKQETLYALLAELKQSLA